MSLDTKQQLESTGQTPVSLQLPDIPDCLQAALGRGHTLPIEGTNVLRVPFGIRQARRQRPDRPERWATLVIPIQSQGSPTPPPQAA